MKDKTKEEFESHMRALILAITRRYRDGSETKHSKETLKRDFDAILNVIQPLLDHARKEGRKEVADWVKAHAISISPYNLEWQAKLKEWGL